MTTLSQLTDQINLLEQERSRLVLLDMLQIEARVIAATQQATLNPALRGELSASMQGRADARQQHEKAADIDARLAELNQARLIAEEDQRRMQREIAEREAIDALNEFKMLAGQVCRSWRRIQQLNGRNQSLKAATVQLPRFTFGHLQTDPRGPYLLSDELAMGRQPWEPDDNNFTYPKAA